MSQVTDKSEPACPRMNGKLDFPCLQIFKLKVLRASKAPPKSTPVLRVARFLVKTKPRRPPLKTSPPVTKYKLKGFLHLRKIQKANFFLEEKDI
jgi:hypothetical protein